MRDGVLSTIKRGKDSEFEWKIKNFSLSEEGYWSPSFTFEGGYWYLVIYPNRTDGYINLRLRRSSPCSPIEVEFSVALKTTEEVKSFERRGRNCFELDQSYGIKWITKSEFSKWQREFLSFRFLSSRCLTILLTMKKADSGEFEYASAAAASSCCKDSLRGDKILLDRKFLNKLVKCAECDEVVNLNNWFEHECQISNAKAATNTSESSRVSQHDKILEQLLLNQEHNDVVLRLKGKDFPAHKAILAVRSPVFAYTFRHKMKENKTGIVDIEDCDPLVFPDFLRFLYCNELNNLSAENVFSLLTMAYKYDCQELRTMCVSFIKENLTVETFCKALALALLHNEAELLCVATDFFLEYAYKILETVDWQAFAAENPTYTNELFIKIVNSTKRSNN